MHLHRLTFQALGPFPGRHTVDFAALGASGLFLLEGPTGSGKSTIIDAIVFALYGKVASREASEERLRSGHVGPETETFVDLVFEGGSGIFRVLRTPAYARPKRHGTGTTQQPATAKLWRLTSPDAAQDGDLIAGRPDEVGGELHRIIGLDRAQFVQTVVLPQGEFASFLRANPEDRRGLLQKVFGTEVYDQVEQRLAGMRAEANRTLQATRDGVGLAVEHFLGATGPATTAAVRASVAELTAPDADAHLLTAVADASGAVQRESTAARELATLAKQACAATQQGVDGARAVTSLVRRRDGLLAERSALAAVADRHALDVVRLALARLAQRVWPSVLGADQAGEAVVRAEAAVRETRASARSRDPELLDLVDEATEPGVRLKTLAVEREGCATRRAWLTRPLELEEGLAARRVAFARTTEAVGGQRAERERMLADLAGRPVLRADLVTLRDASAAVADGLGAAEAEAQAARRRHAAALLAQTLTARTATATVALQASTEAARSATHRVADLQQARIAGIAAELAVALVPGQACPVCGGTEHPRPAAPGPEQVTAEMVAVAEAERVVADRALTEAASALTGLRARHAAADETAEGLDVAAAHARLDEALAAAEQARGALADRDRRDAELAVFDAAGRQLAQDRSDLELRIATSQAELAAAADRLAGDEAEVAAARGDADSVLHRATALDERVAVATAWMAALEELERAGARHAERTAELDAAMSEHDFDDIVAVRAAALGDDALAALETSVRAHESAVVAVGSGLAEPDVAGLPAELTAEGAATRMADAEAAHEGADAEATRAEGEAARLADRASSSAAAAVQVRHAVTELAQARREAGPVVRMANVVAAAGGDNAKQLSLGTYVLVRRFEDVVAAANSRLVVMSGGRYELARSEEREAVRALKKGLAMKVLDHETGVDRDPRTLSGGETFYVSLCLALGLADVVTAEAGGIDLGTLFIDEGFGALDAETLDVVLAELGRLREGGRVVGVVSHVDAMKQSIAERVEVRRTQDGTSTLTVRA